MADVVVDERAPVLFLVPARAGSVRVTGKNLREVGGIPLVGRAVRTARLAARRTPGAGHRVICSTDDPEIAAAARAWGGETPFVRPASLATADTTSAEVVRHALEVLAADGATFRAVVLVQPTAPLVEPDDLVAGIERFDATGEPVVAVSPSHPASWHRDVDDVGRLVGVYASGAFLVNGALYVAAPSAIRAGADVAPAGAARSLVLPPERGVDVDEEQDLVLADAILTSRPVGTFVVGGRRIGDGHTFVIAEAGVNHDGDPAVAHALIDAAADAGADAVKFQTFDPDALAAGGAPLAEYQRVSASDVTDQRAMLARLALPIEAWPGLRDHAIDRGLVFFSSPFDLGSAAMLDGIGVQAFKIASGELTNLPFLETIARYGRPMLVSTGLADLREVALAVDAIVGAGDPPVALLHCVSAYPAEPADANLRAIATLRAAFGVPAGWSDHMPDGRVAVASVAAGAAIVEKHLTLGRGRSGPDHAASIEPDEFGDLVADIRVIEAALGTGRKVPTAVEGPIAAIARKSLHWADSLPAGAVVTPRHLVAMRPGTGLSPGDMPLIVGRATRRAVAAGALVSAADLDSDP